MQDTMAQALRSFHRFQPGTNCRAWLITILQRIVSNRRRAKGRSIVVSDPDDPSPIPCPSFHRCLRCSPTNWCYHPPRLPTMFQEVILLCDVEELWNKEAAHALAIPIGTVMSRLHRGRAQLRSELVAADAVFVRCRPNGDEVIAPDERVEAS